MRKASDEEISFAYKEFGSIYRVAEIFNMCPQSVHERLCRLGENKKINILTENEKVQIKNLYVSGFKRGDGKLKNLSKNIKRTPQFIARYAKSINLTSYSRDCADILSENISLRTKNWISANGHPKGMLGKKHSKEYCKKISKRVSLWHQNATPEMKLQRTMKQVTTQRKKGSFDKPHGSWKAAWHIIGGKRKFFRSSWEVIYAKYLEHLKIQGEILDWFHEPETFWFLEIMRGSRSYLPDFKVISLDGSHHWVEVKGWMDDRSKTKLKRFAKYYPMEKIIVIGKDWFKEKIDILKRLDENFTGR